MLKSPYNPLLIERTIREALDRGNHMRIGEDDIVRIPQIQGRISHRLAPYDHEYIELIYNTWYDPESKQMRNRKVTIGEVLDIFPSAMTPTDAYWDYFDIKTGELKKPLEEDDKPRKKKAKAKTPAPAEEKPTKKEPEEKNEAEKKTESQPQPVLEPKPETETKTEEEDDFRQGREDLVNNMIRYRRERAQELRHKLEREDEDKLRQELYGDEQQQPETEEDLADAERKLRKIFHLPEKKEENTAEDGKEKAETEEPRETGGTAMENETPASGTENRGFQQAFNDYEKERERAAILKQILNGIADTVRNQAKKHPNDIISAYKVNKINAILTELRGRYKNSGYQDLLELLEEPREEEDKDGRIRITGMTYSDAEVLLSHYEKITKFVRVDKKQKT